MYGYDHGDKTYRKPQKGDGERIPKHGGKGYHFYEKNETVVEDTVSKPGPVLSAATRGHYMKGKKPKNVPSASAVADALAKHWGGKGRGPVGRGGGESFDGVEWG
jgi:hypothetical protein